MDQIEVVNEETILAKIRCFLVKPSVSMFINLINLINKIDGKCQIISH